jgi:hypothetical protein
MWRRPFLRQPSLVQRYSKSRLLAGHDAHVARYLDVGTADVVAALLAQVRPVQLALLAAVHGSARCRPVADAVAYLFVRAGRRMLGRAVSRVFRATMASPLGLGQALGLRAYGHAAIGLARPQLQLDGRILAQMDAVDAQAAHSPAVGRAHYARMFGERGGLEDEAVRVALVASASWQQLLELQSAPAALDNVMPAVTTRVGGGAASASGGSPGIEAALMAATDAAAAATTVATSAAAAAAAAVATGTMRQPVQVHAGPPPSNETPIAAPLSPTILASAIVPCVQTALWPASLTAAIVRALDRLYTSGDGVWRRRAPAPDLMTAMHALVMRPTADVLVVLPTGAGKTLLVLADRGSKPPPPLAWPGAAAPLGADLRRMRRRVR